MRHRGRGRNGPGVMGTMARAAVDADTATAVSRAQRAANAESNRREQLAERASHSPASEQVVTVLKELAALRDQGVLTAEEFASQKARLLG
jgi:hypothetical protein